MKQDEFAQLESTIETLSPKERHRLLERLQQLEELPAVVECLEQYLKEHPRCPKCGHEKIHRWGTANGLQRYRCRHCLKTFTALTDTPLSRLRKREMWAEYTQSMLDSEPLRKASDRCHIQLDTSFRWRHRFLKLTEYLHAHGLDGLVEVDRTLFRASSKGVGKGPK